jgi:hypothetical protein
VNFAYTNFYFWDGERDLSTCYREGEPLPDGNPGRRLIFADLYGTSTVIVQRELLRKSGGFDPSFDGCGDWGMWLWLAENGLWARGIREPLVRYRCWAGNASNHKLKAAEGNVRVLEKSLRATQRPEWRPLYQRSLALARAKLELARARFRIETEPDTVPSAILRAWRLYPKRVEWLLWYLLAAWPDALGGRTTAAIIHHKMIRKW